MASSGIEVVRDRGLTEVALARPDRRNAFDQDTVDDLLAVLATAGENVQTRAIVLTGRGSAFCSGFDLARLRSLGEPGANEIRIVESLMSAISTSPVPVIAAVNGPAIGAGCDLALACDIRVGHAGSTFRVPAVKTGLLYGPASTRRLIEAFGGSLARAMLLTGEPVDAQRCLTLGVLWTVVAEDEVLNHARSLALMIAANAPLSVGALKRFARLPEEPTLDAELRALEDRVWMSEDAALGVRAFLERRSADFTGS